MSEKRGPLEDAEGVVPQDPHDRAKAALPKSRVLRDWSSYPFLKKEALGPTSLGHPAYPRSKDTGDQNMPEKRRPAKSANRTLRKTRVARSGLHCSKSNPDRDTGSPIASNQADETEGVPILVEK